MTVVRLLFRGGGGSPLRGWLRVGSPLVAVGDLGIARHHCSAETSQRTRWPGGRGAAEVQFGCKGSLFVAYIIRDDLKFNLFYPNFLDIAKK
ncbi:MAG: hypothetical protein K6C30_07155 [Bacteroidaceae bacterium]|nr:hypothetical protein [Bacteroidaceae bacterium]